jgi:hypothetical protein
MSYLGDDGVAKLLVSYRAGLGDREFREEDFENVVGQVTADAIIGDMARGAVAGEIHPSLEGDHVIYLRLGEEPPRDLFTEREGTGKATLARTRSLLDKARKLALKIENNGN